VLTTPESYASKMIVICSKYTLTKKEKTVNVLWEYSVLIRLLPMHCRAKELNSDSAISGSAKSRLHRFNRVRRLLLFAMTQIGNISLMI